MDELTMNGVSIARGAAVWAAAVATFLSAHAGTSAFLSQPQMVDAMRDTPLLAARRDLILARNLVLKHRYQAAVPPLLATADALAYFEQQQLGQRGSDAGWLRQEIEDYASRIATDHSDALRRIGAWLDQIRAWERRE